MEIRIFESIDTPAALEYGIGTSSGGRQWHNALGTILSRARGNNNARRRSQCALRNPRNESMIDDARGVGVISPTRMRAIVPRALSLRIQYLRHSRTTPSSSALIP